MSPSTATNPSSADTIPFLDAVKGRRSMYHLSPESTISDDRIKELVDFTIKNAPSAFNVQSARAVILLGDQHRILWNDIVPKHMKPTMPAERWVRFENRIQGHANAYGTVMFFEDEEAVEALGEKEPAVKSMLTEWSAHGQGLTQFILWAAFEAEGLGANLQHFNFHPAISEEMKTTWKLSSRWTPHAQMVFGKPTAPAGERKYEDLEHRVKVFA